MYRVHVLIKFICMHVSFNLNSCHYSCVHQNTFTVMELCMYVYCPAIYLGYIYMYHAILNMNA